VSGRQAYLDVRVLFSSLRHQHDYSRDPNTISTFTSQMLVHQPSASPVCGSFAPMQIVFKQGSGPQLLRSIGHGGHWDQYHNFTKLRLTQSSYRITYHKVYGRYTAAPRSCHSLCCLVSGNVVSFPTGLVACGGVR
jgi:hypothetical protein